MGKAYYAIIPADVRYDKKLTANAKLLYGEITALCNEKGYCWASNSYFAELYEVSKETASRWISSLEKSGHIKTRLIYGEGTRSVKERRIYLPHIPIDKIVNTPRQNNQDPIDKNINTPIDKNVKDNNTSFNNTFNTATTTDENKNNEELATDIDDNFIKQKTKSVTPVDADSTKQNNALNKIEHYYLTKVRQQNMCSSNDLQAIVKVHEEYKDIDFVLKVIQQATEQNIERNGKSKINSFRYFVPILEEEWDKRRVKEEAMRSGASDNQRKQNTRTPYKATEDSAKRAGVISL